MFLIQLFTREKTRLTALRYIFCDDAHLLNINQTFLKHDDLTDIITFNLSEDHTVNGEVYISVERIKENAETYRVSIERELLRVIFHGALHLCGYKDKTSKDAAVMRKKEDDYLELYLNVPRGTNRIVK